ncbi:hypothetical protein [Streptomyces laculatispora]|uniref:hypothetical protein n=1 Tax=Streptomyces laculatispora TaxID=887464 RepID=UPI001A9410C4|nr:hypothetical protein [Streptomyces laculatispora]MBO0915675.1 hypothetical protein [Streptomyces laculatispora]
MIHFWRAAFMLSLVGSGIIGILVAVSMAGVLGLEGEQEMNDILLQSFVAGALVSTLFAALVASVNSVHLMRNVARFGLQVENSSPSVRYVQEFAAPVVEVADTTQLIEASVRGLKECAGLSAEVKIANAETAHIVCSGASGGNVILEIQTSIVSNSVHVSIKTAPESSWKRLNGGASWIISEIARSVVTKSTVR